MPRCARTSDATNYGIPIALLSQDVCKGMEYWWVIGLVLVIALAWVLTRVSVSVVPAAKSGGCGSCPKKQNNPTVW